MSNESASGAPDFTTLLKSALDGLGHLSGGATTGPGATGSGATGSGATGSATPTTCGVCPLCLGIAAIARTHPQVLVHLGEAATALAAAAAAATAPAASGEPDPEPPRRPNTGPATGPSVQHIDVDG